MYKKFVIALALCAAASAASAASADDDTRRGVYVGADVGKSSLQNGGSGSGAGVFAGYQFTRYVSAELAYRDLGDLGSWDSVKMKQKVVAAVITVPFAEKWTFIDRIGVCELDEDIHSVYGNGQTTKTGTTIGIGMEYSLTPAAHLRAEIALPARNVVNLNVGVLMHF